MELSIKTPEDLIQFIDSHFDNISDNQYMDIIKRSMGLNTFGKPYTKEIAIEDITRANRIITQNPSNKKMLFIEQEEDEYKFIDILKRIRTI